MAVKLSGYDLIEKLYESSRTLVYRARNEQTGDSEILKMLSKARPSPEDLVRYRHEFELTNRLSGPGIIEVRRLEETIRGALLVFEDIGGESLAQTLRRRHFEVGEFLPIAIEICAALGDVHAQGVIHKDINPSNIVWNPASRRIKLIDFGIATAHAQEWPSQDEAGRSVGTLAYMSPEQTGRTNRRLDYRTDFYSLGATFYEMLTGRRPCEGRDDLEVFHCHLAIEPRPPSELRPEVPSIVSRIILKLLAKPAEERYQSAHGLQRDLERCLGQFRAHGTISKFELGDEDVRATLQISQRLYGRQAESDRLLEAFERAGRDGRHFVLVGGSAGVGKSALVRNVQRPVVGRRAYFASAKFDQNMRDAPYSAFSEIFGQLLSQILALAPREVDHWRERIDEALATDGALLCEVAPQLEALVGPQPAQVTKSPEEARHRLSQVVRRFVALFCEPGRPLTLFFDDMQWADMASLELLAALLDASELAHLLLIGTYRDEEVDAAHPLSRTLSRLEDGDGAVEELQLTALDEASVRALVADTLQRPVDEVVELAALIRDKTSGNPYFLNCFIEDLYARKLLWFDASQGRWCWDIDAIESQTLTDNVVELLIARLRKLPEPTQHALKMAALLGAQFLLDELSAVCEAQAHAVYDDLLPALDADILLPRSRPELSVSGDTSTPSVVRRLAFAHDRVQEAAARLLSDEERPQAHLTVGRLLYERYESERYKTEQETAGGDALLFDVVSHLDKARSLIDNPTERLDLARLNLAAARNAAGSLAFSSAANLLSIARELLPEDIWQIDHDLAFEVTRLLGEAESALGHFERAQRLLDECLDKLTEPTERAKVYSILVRQHANQAEFPRALETARAGLAELGVDFEDTDIDQALGAQFARVQQKLGGRAVTVITDIERRDDARIEAALMLLGALQPAAALLDQRLLLLDGLKALELSLEVGLRPHTTLGLAVYGMVLVGQGQFGEACEAAQLGVELAERFADEFTAAHVGLLYGGMIAHWARPLDEAIDALERAEQAGVRSGNLQFTGYALTNRLYQQFCRGRSLVELVEPMRNAVAYSKQTNNRVAIDQGRSMLTLTCHLLGELDDKDFVRGEAHDWAEDLLASYREHHSETVELSMRGVRGILHYLYGRPHRALEDLERVEREELALLNTIDVSRATFYRAMAYAEGARRAEDRQNKTRYLDGLEKERERIASWAKSCAFNFSHQLSIVDAERAWLRGDVLEAIDLYDRTTELARERGFIEVEALAYERAAMLWLARQKPRYAQMYLLDALYAYRLWGAATKVEQIEHDYAELLAQSREALGGDERSGWSTTSTSGAEIDVTSVFRASESIARNIEVDDLLTTLMRVTIANAGAQCGSFFVRRNGTTQLVVEGIAGDRPRLVEPTLVNPPRPVASWSGGARSVVRYVLRTGEPVVISNAGADKRFKDDPYVIEHKARSILCMPVEEAGELRGVLYLENSLADAAFTPKSLKVLKVLAGHIAVSLSKAQLYEEVRQEKERFRQLAENIHEVFWLMDWPEKTIVYVSPAFRTTWGRPLPETPLSLSKWLEAVAPEDRQRVEQALEEDLGSGEYDILYQIERPSGARRHIRDRGFPIRREDGQIYRIAGVAEDITRQHEVEKMKDEFISVVSHELRTPLTPIKGIFEILAKDEGILASQHTNKMVELGLRNSRRLLRLINDLLDIQKLSLANIKFEFDHVDLVAIVTEALQINEPLGQSKDIEFVLTVGEPNLRVHVDRERLMQVLTNLLSNAVKFSEPSDVVEVGVDKRGAHASITVTDYGPGIPESARERVFEKFVQADSSLTRKHGGAGLGLAISQAIVERLGGKIYLESEVGKGTTFHVDLPLVE